MPGRKVFTREVLASADVQDYLMDQAVMRFASANARAVEIPTPEEGMVTYLEDVDRLEYHDGAGWRGVGSSPVAANINGASPGQPSSTRWGAGAMSLAGQRGGFTIPSGSSDRVRFPTAAHGAGIYSLSWRIRFTGAVVTPGSYGNMTAWAAASPTPDTTAAQIHTIAGPGNDPVAYMSGLIEAAAGDILLLASYFPLSATSPTSSTIRLVKLSDRL